MQESVERYSASGRAEVPESAGYDRKPVQGQTALLGEKSDEARIRLVGRKTPQGRSGNATAEFDVQDHLLHAGDSRAGESFAVKMYVEIPGWVVGDANRSGILAGTAEEKISEDPGFLRRGTVFCPQEKCAGAVAE